VYNFNHAPAALRHTGRISRACSSLARLARATTLSVTVLLASAVMPGTAWNAVALEKASEHAIKVTGSARTAMVNVSIGKSADVRTDAPFVDITVADPEIADVNPLTDRAISILGKKDGTTRVSVYAQDKKLVGVFDVAVSYDTTLLSREIQNRFPHANLRVTTVNGKLMVAGNAPDATTVDQAITIAKQFGPDVINMVSVNSPQQVMLEVRFIEIARNAGRDLGVQWNVESDRAVANVGSRQPAAQLPFGAAATAAAGVLSGGSPFGFAIGRLISSGGVNADTLINALEQKGIARSLAEPNLVALSGDTASFLAGGEYPIPVSGNLGQITVDYKRYGVGLAFTPTVLGGGLINLKIEPEVSQIDTTHTVSVGSNILVPALSVRRASTTIELRDGQSFVIGGLLQNDSNNSIEQVPWLGDVPVLGTLFRSASFQKKETDLAIIVTPRLVRATRPGETVRDPSDSTTLPNDPELFLLGKTEINKATMRKAEAGALQFTGHILDLPKGAAVVSARN
jgi:pilus assembly protein CpaC